jgi:hypothetical protein
MVAIRVNRPHPADGEFGRDREGARRVLRPVHANEDAERTGLRLLAHRTSPIDGLITTAAPFSPGPP